MPASSSHELLALLEQASGGLGDVQATVAHGCAALAVGERAFVLVAPRGRIGVRLPDWDLFAAAYELPGSGPLLVDGERVGHWVLLPEAIEDDGEALAEWLRQAHALTGSRV